VSDSTVFQIWHADADEPNVARHSLSLGTTGDDVETRVRRAAELAANLDADVLLHAWPTTYCVLDGEGRLWRVLVDRVTRPSYTSIEIEEAQPMMPAVHVLWQGQAACEDARLASIPARWPEGQQWMSLSEFALGHEPSGIRCEACWRRAPALVGKMPR
jgi:hypothetical protein